MHLIMIFQKVWSRTQQPSLPLLYCSQPEVAKRGEDYKSDQGR